MGADQITVDKRADISHCFPVRCSLSYTDGDREGRERGVRVSWDIRRHTLAHPYHPLTHLHTTIYVTIHKIPSRDASNSAGKHSNHSWAEKFQLILTNGGPVGGPNM